MEPVKEAIKKLYSTLETQLDVEELIGKLMSAGLAGLMLRHEVQRRPTKIDKNRAILDNLQYYLPKELRSFCDVLSTCSPPMGPELAQKISDCLDDELGLSVRTKVYPVHMPVLTPTTSEAAPAQQIIGG
jgi:hypothetical protein